MAKNSKGKEGRARNIMMGFRISPEELEHLNKMVALSGLTKQEYILRRIRNKEVIVIGNPRVYKALKTMLINVYGQLEEIKRTGSPISEELIETLNLIGNVLGEIKNEGIRKE